MKLPNKVTSYKRSIIPKFPIVLRTLQKENMTPMDLYKKVKRQIGNIAEFVAILDCLYILKKIDYIDGEVLCYVENDPM